MASTEKAGQATKPDESTAKREEPKKPTNPKKRTRSNEEDEDESAVKVSRHRRAGEIRNGVVESCRKLTLPLGNGFTPAKARKVSQLLGHYTGLLQVRSLARYLVSAPLVYALCEYVKDDLKPGYNGIRAVLQLAVHAGEEIKKEPGKSLTELMKLDKLSSGSADGKKQNVTQTKFKKQNKQAYILAWLVHTSNDWYDLELDKRQTDQDDAAAVFAQQFKGHTLPALQVADTSQGDFPAWGPHKEFGEIQMESYNRAQELLHALYLKATGASEPSEVFGKSENILVDETYFSDTFMPSWMKGASSFDAAEHVEAESSKTEIKPCAIELIWDKRRNFANGDYGQETSEHLSSGIVDATLIEELSKELDVRYDPRRFDHSSQWRDTIRQQLQLQGLNMNLASLYWSAKGARGNLLESVDWEEFHEPANNNDEVSVMYALCVLGPDEILMESEVPFDVPSQFADERTRLELV